jgi:hypothetical protein
MIIYCTSLKKPIDQLVEHHRGDATVVDVCMQVMTDLVEGGYVDELAMQYGVDMTVLDDRQATFEHQVELYVEQRVCERLRVTHPGERLMISRSPGDGETAALRE